METIAEETGGKFQRSVTLSSTQINQTLTASWLKLTHLPNRNRTNARTKHDLSALQSSTSFAHWRKLRCATTLLRLLCLMCPMFEAEPATPRSATCPTTYTMWCAGRWCTSAWPGVCAEPRQSAIRTGNLGGALQCRVIFSVQGRCSAHSAFSSMSRLLSPTPRR